MVEFDAVHPSDRYRPMEQDPHPRLGEYRVTDASALVGSGVWLALAGTAAVDSLELSAVDLFVALALLVVVPLALGIVATRRRSGGDSLPYRIAAVGQPVGALAAVAALALAATGAVRAALLLPWLGVTLATAAFALWRLGSRGPLPLPELAIDAALVAPAVGALALLLGGASTPGDELTAIELAGIHAHYAGLVLPLVAGRAGRVVTGSSGRYPRTAGGAFTAAATIAFVLTLPLLAIAAGDDATLGLAAVGLLAFAALALALSLLTAVVPAVAPRPGVLLAVAALALGVTMALAAAAVTTDLVAVADMVVWHGTIGAVGIAVPALVAFRLLD